MSLGHLCGAWHRRRSQKSYKGLGRRRYKKKYSCKGKTTKANEKKSCNFNYKLTFKLQRTANEDAAKRRIYKRPAQQKMYNYLQLRSHHTFSNSLRLRGPWRADREGSWNSGYRLQRKSCFRVCLSILHKVDHNRGVSALTMLIRVKHLLCIFFSSASTTKSMHRGN